jgi:hypothetical protein
MINLGSERRLPKSTFMNLSASDSPRARAADP